MKPNNFAVSVDRTRDLQIFSLTLSQLSYPRFVMLNGIQNLVKYMDGPQTSFTIYISKLIRWCYSDS
jgi:hypothetical protein